MPDVQRRGDADSVTTNPYAPTSETLAQAPTLNDTEAYRRAHLKHETSCKSVGTLFLVSSILVVLGCLISLLGYTQMGIVGPTNTPSFVMNLVVMLIVLLQGAVGYGLRRLRSWAKTGGIIFSMFGLLGFPVGTLFCGYFLYLLLCKKGQIVFSSSYQDIVAQTPHIQYKTPLIVWLIALALLVLPFSLLFLR